MQAATEEEQGPLRGHIRLEETRAPDHHFPESVGTLDLLCAERDRHSQSREKGHRTADRDLPLNEEGYFHQIGRDTRDVIFLLIGTHDPGFRTRTTIVMPTALLLQYDVLSMLLVSLPQSLPVALRLISIQRG